MATLRATFVLIRVNVGPVSLAALPQEWPHLGPVLWASFVLIRADVGPILDGSGGKQSQGRSSGRRSTLPDPPPPLQDSVARQGLGERQGAPGSAECGAAAAPPCAAMAACVPTALCAAAAPPAAAASVSCASGSADAGPGPREHVGRISRGRCSWPAPPGMESPPAKNFLLRLHSRTAAGRPVGGWVGQPRLSSADDRPCLDGRPTC